MKNLKYLSLVKYVLLVLGVLTLVPMFTIDINSVDMMLLCAYVFFGIAVVLLIVLAALNFGKDSGGSKIGRWVGLGIIIVAVLSYFFLAKMDPVKLADGTVYSDALTLKGTDTMLYVAYVTFAAMIVVVIGGEIRNSLK